MKRPAARRGPDAVPRLGGRLEFLRLLWGVDHALQKASKRMERTHRITGPQRLVVRIVGRFPDLPVGHLARILGVHPSTVTGLSQRLIGRGLLRRRTDPRDARRFLLRLTAAGRAAEREAPGTIEAAIGALLAAESRQALKTTIGVLEHLRDILSKRDTNQ